MNNDGKTDTNSSPLSLSFVDKGLKFVLVEDDDGVITAAIIGLDDCTRTNVYIPDTVELDGVFYPITEIGRFAFCGFRDLTGDLKLPAGLTSIDALAFAGCSGLISLTLPKGLIAIDERAFAGCSSLTSVTLPASLTSIGNEAFYDCASLTSVTLLSTTPPVLGYAAFYGHAKFTCPDEALGLYQADENWIPYFGGIDGVEAVVGGSGGSGENPVALYNLCGQLLRKATVTQPASPSVLRTVFGVPSGLYILATPTGTRKIKL